MRYKGQYIKPRLRKTVIRLAEANGITVKQIFNGRTKLVASLRKDIYKRLTLRGWSVGKFVIVQGEEYPVLKTIMCV